MERTKHNGNWLKMRETLAIEILSNFLEYSCKNRTDLFRNNCSLVFFTSEVQSCKKVSCDGEIYETKLHRKSFLSGMAVVESPGFLR